jgi:hypothetical protein
MRVWLACFFVLFALAELFDWVKEFTLPLPIYILGGAFLAVASNYDKIVGSYFSDVTAETPSQQAHLDSPPGGDRSVSLPISRSVEKLQQSEIKD